MSQGRNFCGSLRIRWVTCSQRSIAFMRLVCIKAGRRFVPIAAVRHYARRCARLATFGQ